MFSRDELKKILDAIDVEYEFDSVTPGMIDSQGNYYTYEQLPLPSEYFGALCIDNSLQLNAKMETVYKQKEKVTYVPVNKTKLSVKSALINLGGAA